MLSGKDWDIWKREDGTFHATAPGWFSPSLSVIGGWNLAQQVEVTPEKFEREFGINPRTLKVELTIKDFVKLLYTNGELPIEIDASPPYISTISEVYDAFLEDLDYQVEEGDFSKGRAKVIKKHCEKVYNFFTSLTTPYMEIFQEIKPFFEDFSSIVIKKDKVIVKSVYDFVEECKENKHGWFMFLYECFYY